MLTGGMGYSYNVTQRQPLTQTNLTAYPVTELRRIRPTPATERVRVA